MSHSNVTQPGINVYGLLQPVPVWKSSQGIEIFRNNSELYKDSFIVLENEHENIISIIHSGRIGYLGFENALQVMINFISFGSISVPNQEVFLEFPLKIPLFQIF